MNVILLKEQRKGKEEESDRERIYLQLHSYSLHALHVLNI